MFHQQQANIHSVRVHPVEKSIASSWCIWSSLHWKVKSVQIRSYFWYAFSFIRTEYGDLLRNLCIQSECRKMEIRKNSVFGHFSRRVSLKIKLETKTISLFRVAIQTLKYGQKVFQSFINPFHATGLFRYPLKTSTSQRFSYVFRGYWKTPVVWNGLKRYFNIKFVDDCYCDFVRTLLISF